MCMQEIAAGQDVSGGVGSEKLRSVLGNYVSPQKILKQLNESPVLYCRNRFANPVIKFKAQKQVFFMRICFVASRKLYYKYQQLFPETIYKGLFNQIHKNSKIAALLALPLFTVDFSVSSAYNRSREIPTFRALERRCKIMLANMFVDNAKVMAKGQVTIPKDIRKVLGVTSGDRITFIVEGNTVRIVNSAVYAMQVLQKEMAGEAERAGLTSDDDVMALVKELRNEDDNA